jgi:hypothetical protein
MLNLTTHLCRDGGAFDLQSGLDRRRALGNGRAEAQDREAV